jgi:hypothetical protein
VDNEGGSFTILVCAESLRQAKRTTKTRYPESAVSITFPSEPACFFVDGPHTGGYAGLDATGELIGTRRPA